MPHPLIRSALLAVAATLLVAPPAGAVVGGTPTPAAEGRFAVALVDADVGRSTVAEGQFCGATLVRPDVLVTAAHCLLDEDGETTAPQDLRVFTGHVLPLRRGPLRRVVAAAIHPDFDDGAGTLDADVAVVRLAAPVRGVRPVALATPADLASAQPGAALRVWGWGNRAPGEGLNFPRQLHDAAVERFGDRRCDDLYGRAFNPASQMCVGWADGHADACSGDSGGPLTATGVGGRPVLVGVVSYGVGCGRPEFPTVYTKLRRYRTFLAAALAPVRRGR